MITKYCTGCGCELELGINWWKSSKKTNNYICKSCHTNKTKMWVLANPIKHKVANDKADKKFKLAHHNYFAKKQAEWREAHPERSKLINKKHRQTEKGQASHNRSQAKRDRNLDWIELYPNPFADSVSIRWHHVSDQFVVALPTDIHVLYSGWKEHRELCMNVVNQIYLLEQYPYT